MSYVNVSAEQEAAWEREKMRCLARHVCRMPKLEERRAFVARQDRLHGEQFGQRLRDEVVQAWEETRHERAG